MNVCVRPNRPVWLAFALLVCLVSPARRADAQPPVPTQPTVEQPQTQQPAPEQPPPGPFGELFVKRNRADRQERQTLTFTLNGYGGYDSNPISDQPGVAGGPTPQIGGSGLLGGDAGLEYAKTGHRASYALNTNGAYRYFPSQPAVSTSSFDASGGLEYQVAHRTHFRLDESFEYQPYYQLGLFPGFGQPELGAGLSSNLDFAVLKRKSLLSVTSSGLEQQLSRRSTIALTGSFISQTLDHGSGTTATDTTNDNLRGYTVGLTFRRQLSRYLTLRLGDEYRYFVYPSPSRLTLQGNNIDVGLDYSRSLAFSRHTTFSFSTGTSIIRFDGRQFADVTGNASLTHLLTRNWQTRVSYNRDLNFVQTLSQPLFADSASVMLQGIINRKWLMSLSGGYLSGSLGLRENSNENSTLRTGTGEFSLIYAFTDALRANFSYSYFSYHFSNNALLPSGLRSTYDRNSVRGGLSLVLPLIH